MHDHWHPFTIVPYFNDTFSLINMDFDLSDPFWISLNVVSRIYNNFIEYFVNAWNVWYLFLDHFGLWAAWIIDNPHLLALWIGGANVTIRAQQNMLKLRLLLVDAFNIRGLLISAHYFKRNYLFIQIFK